MALGGLILPPLVLLAALAALGSALIGASTPSPARDLTARRRPVGLAKPLSSWIYCYGLARPLVVISVSCGGAFGLSYRWQDDADAGVVLETISYHQTDGRMLAARLDLDN